MINIRIIYCIIVLVSIFEYSCKKSDKNINNPNIPENPPSDSLNNNGSGYSIGKSLPAWQDGQLDIHFINSARGECVFLILPDSTTLLLDAGDIYPSTSPKLAPLKPNPQTTAGNLYGHYILELLSHFPKPMQKIDYAVISHFHYDHMGGIRDDRKWDPTHTYQLGGITEIPEYIPIKKIIDRGWPNYDWPVDIFKRDEDADNLMMLNYVDFLDWQIDNKSLKVEKIKPGRKDQVTLLNRPEKFPNFEVRNISGNGYLWTGSGDNVKNQIPPSKDVTHYNGTLENKLSIGFKISYGKFDYFTAGDMNYRGYEKDDPKIEWRDFETPLAGAVGSVEVMKADHHANYDANSLGFLGILKPQNILIAASLVSQQPDAGVLEDIFSTDFYDEPRGVFTTNYRNRSDIASYESRITGKNGHIVVRVERGGDKYNIYMLKDTDLSFTIKSISGPYSCK